jgi:effector-binding domain-containing protein
MPYNCELKEQPAQPTLSVRTRLAVQDLTSLFGRVYGGIFQYLGGLGEQPAGPPFAIYYNMDMQDLDVEIGVPVARPLPGQGELMPGEFPAGKMATCLHVGPYDQCTSAYAALTEWIKANGYEAAGVAYEFYLNGPPETPPEELQTIIAFPLKTT